MQYDALWRTTTFRLTILYGLIFSVGVLALLGMVYARSEIYLTRRVDTILNIEAQGLAHSPRTGLRQRIAEDLMVNGSKNNIVALFSSKGSYLAGNLVAVPANLVVGGKPVEIPPTASFPARARLIGLRLAAGDLLIVGRDIDQIRELRMIVASALIWSGVVIILAGLAGGVALSVRPLHRLKLLQTAGEEIARGDMDRRLPVSRHNDELDQLAATVNFMMGEVQRLMTEIQGSTETLAHDLLMPLTRASTRMRRIQQSGIFVEQDIAVALAEVREVIERFRAIMRISELQSGARRAGFASVDLAKIIESVATLYLPMAEENGVRLSVHIVGGGVIHADAQLMVEAISNLVDNALKFTPAGGSVQVRLETDRSAPMVVVEDNGPGIAENERASVLQRFYRGERHRTTAGSGLGLSVIAAIIHLHDFELVLDDAQPGLRAIIHCRVGSLDP